MSQHILLVSGDCSYDVPFGAGEHSSFISDNPDYEEAVESGENITIDVPAMAMSGEQVMRVAEFLGLLVANPFDTIATNENGDWDPDSLHMRDHFPQPLVDWVNTIPGLYLPKLRAAGVFMGCQHLIDVAQMKIYGIIFRRNAEAVCTALGITVQQLDTVNPREKHFINWVNPTYQHTDKWGKELDDESSECVQDVSYLQYFDGFNWHGQEQGFVAAFDSKGLDLSNLPDGFSIPEFLLELRKEKRALEEEANKRAEEAVEESKGEEEDMET